MPMMMTTEEIESLPVAERVDRQRFDEVLRGLHTFDQASEPNLTLVRLRTSWYVVGMHAVRPDGSENFVLRTRCIAQHPEDFQDPRCKASRFA